MSHDWRKIAKEHGPMVWRSVFRVLRSHAESLDCYQDVMLEAFERTGGKQIDNWAGYLRWLAVHRALDRFRSSQRRQQVVRTRPDMEHVYGTTTESELEIEELKDRLRSELAALPESQAEAFWLRFIEEMSYSEIAEQMGLDTNAVGVLIHRARPRVRQALSDLQPKRS